MNTYGKLMSTYEKILANGGSAAQLLGFSLSEYSMYISYDEETGKISDETASQLEERKEALENARKELEMWKTKTLEDYRAELIEMYSENLSKHTDRLNTYQRIFDSAKDRLEELELLHSTNDRVECALKALLRNLRSTLWSSQSEVDYLKNKVAELEKDISDLVAWSPKTQESIKEKLEYKIKDAEVLVDRKESVVRNFERTIRYNKTIMEAYEEITDFLAEEAGMEK